MAAQRSAPIDTLSDDLLGAILRLAQPSRVSERREFRHAAALVCRRWRHVVLADALHTFRLSSTHAAAPGWFEGKGRLLERWGAAVQCLAVDDGGALAGGGAGGAWPLARYVSLLRPGALRALSWSSEAALPPDVAARLPALTGLASLTLLNRGGPPLQLAAGTLGALGRLAQLRCLVCFCSEWSQPFVDALVQLTALTRLHLQEGWAAAQPSCEPCALACFGGLTALRALRQLELCTSGRPPGACTLRLPPLAGLQHLRLVSVNANSMQVGDASLCGKARYEGGRLDLRSLRALRALGPLLAALLPPAAPLQALVLPTALPAGECDWHGCGPRLAALASLEARLKGGSDAEAALAAVLAQAPALRRLVLQGGAALPACVPAATGLTSLALCEGAGLPGGDLPPGPYLQALQELDLSYTPLARVPPALAAAPALRRLALRGSLAAPLGAPDVRAVLARLPALAELSVDVAALPPPQQLDVRAELPHVRIALQ